MSVPKYQPVKSKEESIRIFVDAITETINAHGAVVVVMVKPDGDFTLRANVPPEKQIGIIDHTLHVLKDMA